MKIIKVEPFVVRVPLGRIIEDSFNSTACYGLAGVHLYTDEGIQGTGYTGTLGAGDDLIRETIERYYAPKLLQRDPFDVKAIWQTLWWSSLHWVGRLGITTMAMAAVDIALWDLMAKAVQKPLWRLLGAAKDGKFKTYNTDGGWLNKPIDVLIEHMKHILDQGWTGVKMKIGKPDPREDYQRVRAVRKALGESIDLMLDVNQTWDLNTARVWGKRLEEFQIEWLEEPMHPDDIPSHAILARDLATPIALGEHVYSKLMFRDYLAQNAVGIVQVDVTRVAGVTEWLEIAGMAACYNRPVVPHIGDAGQVHQHLVGATLNAPKLEFIPIARELFLEPVDVREGTLYLPETPGASTAFVPEVYQRYRIA